MVLIDLLVGMENLIACLEVLRAQVSFGSLRGIVGLLWHRKLELLTKDRSGQSEG